MLVCVLVYLLSCSNDGGGGGGGGGAGIVHQHCNTNVDDGCGIAANDADDDNLT